MEPTYITLDNLTQYNNQVKEDVNEKIATQDTKIQKNTQKIEDILGELVKLTTSIKEIEEAVEKKNQQLLAALNTIESQEYVIEHSQGASKEVTDAIDEAKDDVIEAMSHIHVDMESTGLALQGENENATNTAIFNAVENIVVPDISQLATKTDLDDLAKQSDIPTVSDIQNGLATQSDIPTDYATEDSVKDGNDTAIGLLKHAQNGLAAIKSAIIALPTYQDLMNVQEAIVQVIPDIDGLATSSEMQQDRQDIIDAIDGIDFSGLATSQDVSDASDLIIQNLPDISSLATSTDVSNAQAAVIAAIPSTSALALQGSNANATNTAILAAIPSVSDLATSVNVSDAQTAIIAAIPSVAQIQNGLATSSALENVYNLIGYTISEIDNV